MRRGVSLIEVIVSIAMIAALLAVLAVTLGPSREAARDARDTAALRSLAAALTAYADNHNQHLPAFRSPAEPEIYFHGQPQSRSYFAISSMWHHAYADSTGEFGYGHPALHPLEGAHGTPPNAPFHTAYALSCSFAATPDFWNPLTRRFGPQQLRPVRITAVRFPSEKTLLVSTWPFVTLGFNDRADAGLPAAFVDGSAETAPPNQRLPGHPSGDGSSHRRYGARHMHDFPPMLHTADGTLGRDIARR